MNNKVCVFETNLNTVYLKNKILHNEKKIIQKYPPTDYIGNITDGQTGLGLNSLTSRFFHFNVLKWWGTNSLKYWIKKSYNLYTQTENKSIYVQCWANVMRSGQQIKQHQHSHTYHPYEVSGNLIISSDCSVSTYYNGQPVENQNGTITLFPSNLLHWTDQYVGNDMRVTVAFDIKNYDMWRESVLNDAKQHWIKI